MWPHVDSPAAFIPRISLDLGEREARRLRVPDEPQSIDGVFVVVAIPVGVAVGLAHEADALVVPDRLGREAGLIR